VRAIFTTLSSFFCAPLSSFFAADSLAATEAATRRERVGALVEAAGALAAFGRALSLSLPPCAFAVAALNEQANAKHATNRSAPFGNRTTPAPSPFEFIASTTRIVSSTARTKDKSPRPRACSLSS
jgi:hypothetical protein